MNTYYAHISYVAREKVGGKAINSSAGTGIQVRAANQAGMAIAIMRKLQKLQNAVITELKIIKI